MKPRIWLNTYRGRREWVCNSFGAKWGIGFGMTMAEAYADWLDCRHLDQ